MSDSGGLLLWNCLLRERERERRIGVELSAERQRSIAIVELSAEMLCVVIVLSNTCSNLKHQCVV